MKTQILKTALAALFLSSGPVLAQRHKTFAGRPTKRKEAVEKAHKRAMRQKSEAVVWARAHGFKMRYEQDGQVAELMGIRNGIPQYYTTENENAAISSAANLVRDTSPYNVDGSGITVGVWDERQVLTTHQEFGSRVTIKDSASSTSSHATHVAGTIGAAGVVETAEGMAPHANIDSYDWYSDESEMIAAGSSTPGEAGKIYLSNHSYGAVSGWTTTDYSGNSGYHWHQGLAWEADAEPINFGRYDYAASEWDQVVYDAPYYLPFKSAGNDRNDNPKNDATVYYYDNGWQSAIYDDTLHPLGDGKYKDGYDTIATKACAKNIITIGAANDAVDEANGSRDLSKSTPSYFSGYGPTDDGRIKPDIMANGVTLYSTDDGNDTDYASKSGTSMASPSACGSAALLVDYYDDRFPGEAMRASTLKGLILHTADDLQNPGPDYKTGWGLMNTRTAVELLEAYADGNTNRLTEALLTSSSNTNDTYAIFSEGIVALRATLCWTDPPGAHTSAHDDRTPDLINDLDLIVTGADGTHYPYQLDYANPSANATATGENNIDNVLQVYIAAPLSGDYTITVDFDGTLDGEEQWYSLIMSGDGDLPTAAPEGLFASASNERVDLDWDDNTESDLDFYTVYRSETSGSGYVSITNVTTSAYADTNVVNDTTYYYLVTATDHTALESANSTEVAATPSTIIYIQVASLLDDPSFTSSPDASMPTAGSELYRYVASGEKIQFQTSSNSSVVGDNSSFTAPVNLFDDTVVTGHIDYNPLMTRLISITPNFSDVDISYTGVVGLYGGIQQFDTWYEITLNTAGGTYTATSGVGNVFGDSSSMENELIAAWNTSLSWDTDPFASGGVPYHEINHIGIEWFHTTTVPNTTDDNAWFNMGSATIGYTARIISSTDTNAPGIPTSLTAEGQAGRIELDWDDNPEPDIACYNVLRSETSESGYSLLTTVSASAFSDANVVSGTIYYYVVSAVDFSDNESEYSAEASATPASATQILVTYDFDTGLNESTSANNLVAGNVSYAVGTQDDGAPNSSERAWDPANLASGNYLLNIGQRGLGNYGVVDENLTTTAAATLRFTLSPNSGESLDFSASTLDFDSLLYVDLNSFKVGYKIWADTGSGFVALAPLQVMTSATGSGTEGRLKQTDESTDLPGFSLVNGEVQSSVTLLSFDISSLGALAKDQSVTFAIAMSSNRNNQNNFGNGIDDISIDLTLISTGGYAGWAITYDLTGGATDDDDGDGLSNIHEFGIGGNPTNSADIGYEPMVDMVEDTGTNWMRYIHVRQTDPNSGITYSLEETLDLGDGIWTNANATQIGIPAVLPGDPDFESVTNRLPTVENKKFIRLKIIEAL